MRQNHYESKSDLDDELLIGPEYDFFRFEYHSEQVFHQVAYVHYLKWI